jgi:hypothetical protein
MQMSQQLCLDLVEVSHSERLDQTTSHQLQYYGIVIQNSGESQFLELWFFFAHGTMLKPTRMLNANFCPPDKD